MFICPFNYYFTPKIFLSKGVKNFGERISIIFIRIPSLGLCKKDERNLLGTVYEANLKKLIQDTHASRIFYFYKGKTENAKVQHLLYAKHYIKIPSDYALLVLSVLKTSTVISSSPLPFAFASESIISAYSESSAGAGLFRRSISHEASSPIWHTPSETIII